MEKLIPVSKRQHDVINEVAEAIRGNQKQLETVAAVIVMGQDEEIPRYGIRGAVCKDGVYSLALELPDIAPETEVKSA